jgi:predicted transposase YbfD/YdcC
MKRMKTRHRQPSADEQHVLEHLTVRPVPPHQVGRFDQLIVAHHYLQSAELVGEHLRYVATYRGQWLALAAWSAPALHLKARDAFIGWTEEQRRTRLPLLANNARLLVLPECHYPNLISRFMKLMLARLSADWQARWGHPLALAESFVDPQLYRGTAYKVSGWSRLGPTAGWKRSAEDFYQKHNRPKQVWVRELVKNARVQLRAPALPPAWAGVEQNAAPRCTATAPQIRSLVETLRAEVPECRSKKGLAYPVAGMLALIAMAMFSGVRRGPQDLAEYAATLAEGQLRALGFRRDPHTGRIRCPGVTPFRDVLNRADAGAVERALLRWQEQLLGPAQDSLVIVDGKTLRHAHLELVSAVNGQGRWLGTVPVPEGRNEIPAARDLLAKVDVQQKTALADALHTQIETAQQILFEGGGDYALTVKANQKELLHTLAQRLTPGRFSPSAHVAHPRADAGTQPPPAGNPAAGLLGGHARAGGISRCAPHCPAAPAGAAQRQAQHRDGLSDQQPDPRTTRRAGLAATQARLLGD